MPHCVASGCSNSSKKGNRVQGITFHRFPKNEILREYWIAAINRQEWIPSKYSYLCSAHFSEDQMDRTSLSCVRLRQDAVPNLFPVKRTKLKKVKKTQRASRKKAKPKQQSEVDENEDWVPCESSSPSSKNNRELAPCSPGSIDETKTVKRRSNPPRKKTIRKQLCDEAVDNEVLTGEDSDWISDNSTPASPPPANSEDSVQKILNPSWKKAILKHLSTCMCEENSPEGTDPISNSSLKPFAESGSESEDGDIKSTNLSQIKAKFSRSPRLVRISKRVTSDMLSSSKVNGSIHNLCESDKSVYELVSVRSKKAEIKRSSNPTIIKKQLSQNSDHSYADTVKFIVTKPDEMTDGKLKILANQRWERAKSWKKFKVVKQGSLETYENSKPNKTSNLSSSIPSDKRSEINNSHPKPQNRKMPPVTSPDTQVLSETSHCSDEESSLSSCQEKFKRLSEQMKDLPSEVRSDKQVVPENSNNPCTEIQLKNLSRMLICQRRKIRILQEGKLRMKERCLKLVNIIKRLKHKLLYRR